MNNSYIQQGRNRGAAMLVFILFFLSASSILVLGIGRGAYDDVTLYRTLESGKQSFYAAEAGTEDAIYRYRKEMEYSNSETFTVGGVPVEVTRTLVIDTYQFVSEAISNTAVRTSASEIVIGNGVSFDFGLQGGNGGITLSNNSKVYGDVFANSAVIGEGNATIYGDVVSALGTGLVQHIHATGSAWAHTIHDSNIEKDAYFVTMTATVVGRISYPGSPDQPLGEFPILDSRIQEWKDSIINTGTVIASTSVECSGGKYVINSDTTLGNVKIECDVDVKKQGASTILTVTGPIWIEGNLEFSSGPEIVAASSLGFLSASILVDDESNRTTSSKISVNQSTNFTSGDPQSYTLLLSMNESAELGGGETAINVLQSANGKVLLYASHGLIDIGNSISLKEVTAHQIDVNNGASVIYESGLASLVFKNVEAGYAITSWRETE